MLSKERIQSVAGPGTRLCIVLLSLLILPMLGCRRDKPAPVQIERVERRDITETVAATGRIQPVTQVKISPEVSGEIMQLPVKEGDHVTKGQLLVQIRRDVYEAGVTSAEASHQSARAGLLTAEANARRAAAELERNVTLFAQNLVSASIFDEVRTAHEVAQANAIASTHQVEMAVAALRRSQDDLDRTTIYSPIDGTVAGLNSEAGERVVGTGMMAGTEIMTIADLTEMEARVEVGEVDVVLIEIGQHAHLEVDSFRDRKFPGTVTQVARSAKNVAGMSQQEATKFEVRIHIDEPEAFLPGMSVTAEIETRQRSNVLTVPIQAVTTRLPSGSKPKAEDKASKSPQRKADDPEFEQLDVARNRDSERERPREVVFVLEAGKVRAVPVERGISDDTWYEIVTGLEEGQEVITGPSRAISRELEDGKSVQVAPATTSKSAPSASTR